MKDARRRINTAQLSMRKLHMDVTAATSVVSGFDANQVKSITKNAPGDFTIVLLRPFNAANVNKAKAMVAPMAAGVTYHLAASDFDRVNVVLSADVDFSIEILGCDHRFNY